MKDHSVPRLGRRGPRRQANRWWVEAAPRAGVDLTGFDADAPLEQRLSWALALGLLIGTVYSRFSSKNCNTRPTTRSVSM